ncbi:MAG: hypothetical protein HDT22_01695 [Ruminococcus sp.]|nr:hypothetical protein [Ruminococcus sp.]
MSLSDSRKKANTKWNKTHMKTLSVCLRKEQAEKFKKIVERKGLTTAGMLRKFVLSQIEEENI